MRTLSKAVLVYGMAALATGTSGAGMFRDVTQHRTITTSAYEVSIRRNGEVDINTTQGVPLVSHACALVHLEGEKRPDLLKFSTPGSTRISVSDRLGEGHGVRLPRKNAAWVVHAYTIQPFLTVQVSYTNRKKKPVRVKRLVPWHVGERGGGEVHWRDGNADTLRFSQETGPGPLPEPPGEELPWLLAHDEQTGRSLLVGFLTFQRAVGTVTFNPGQEGGAPALEAGCEFDPPIELAPGETVTSEPLYLAVAEEGPLEALERFGHALAVANNVELAKPFIPHGWVLPMQGPDAVTDEAAVLSEAADLAERFAPYGWTHLSLGPGWERSPGDWRPDPDRFPRGFGPLVRGLHAMGLTVGLSMNPFETGAGGLVGLENPGWLLAPVHEGLIYLDMAEPGARDHVEELCAKVGRAWGFDVLRGVDATPYLDTAGERALLSAPLHREAMLAVRRGLGEDRFVVHVNAPVPVGVYAEAAAPAQPIVPAWRGGKAGWGCVESVRAVTRDYYLAPYLRLTAFPCPVFQADTLTTDQRVAWLTAAALSAGVMELQGRPSAVPDSALDRLSRLLPLLHRPARPLDLLDSETASLWHLTARAAHGTWDLVAVFNWDETQPLDMLVDFGRLGLDTTTAYTVFGFWERRFFGLARGELAVHVPAGGVELLGLRHYEDRPMLLATDGHFAQGAVTLESLDWDSAKGELRGVVMSRAGRGQTFYVHVPGTYAYRGCEATGGEAEAALDGELLRLDLTGSGDGPVAWRLLFSR